MIKRFEKRVLMAAMAVAALNIIEQVIASAEAEDGEPDRKTRFLYMLALDQLERRDEAATVFQTLVEESEFDLELLYQYFQFCEKNRRAACKGTGFSGRVPRLPLPQTQ